MSPKTWIAAGVLIGSTVGGYIPALWGDSVFSMTSIFFTFLGGIAGIYFGQKMSDY